jgi:hypothetical protein
MFERIAGVGKILRYNASMARYRKLSIVSLVGLASIVIALYSHQLVDSNPEQNQTAHAVSGSKPADKIQAGSQIIPPGKDSQEVLSAIEAPLITEDLQDLTTESESITLSGWVGTEFGGNIAGETVVLYSGHLSVSYSMITGISGEFIFTDLKPSYDYVLKVSPQGMFKRYTKYPLKLRSDQEVFNIVLESIPLGTLTGRIADPYGRTVTGIELFIKSLEIDSWSTKVITDTNGSFSVAEFPKGRFQMSTRGQQSLTATGFRFDPATATGEVVNLTIDVGPYHLSGRIYDESGHSIDGAYVFLNWTLMENGISIRSIRQVSADANGEFLFTELGPGDHELVVSAWRDNTVGQIIKRTIRQTVNVSVDPQELIIYINTL